MTVYGCIPPFSFACVRTGQVGIVERLGAYSHMAQEGLNCYIWPIFRVAKVLSLRVQQLDVKVETKTKDNVFVMVEVSVQYNVKRDNANDAYYQLSNSQEQLRSYIFDVIRSTVPRMELDDAFISKDDIAQSVKEQLSDNMNSFGYEIQQALVTDLTPDIRVKTSMNEINANRRKRFAAQYKADAEKISTVKLAEANAESRYLSGCGVANQRKAIVHGLKESVNEFAVSVSDTDAHDVMTLLLTTQYLDMLNNIGARPNVNCVMIPDDAEEMVK